MGKTRRVDNREFEDYQNPRKSKYNRNGKKKSKVVDTSVDSYFDPDLEPDAPRHRVEEHGDEELNPERER